MKMSTEYRFEKTLSSKEISYICEIKRASPSRGIIVEDFQYISLAKEYEIARADSISVLTEPDYFMGCDEYLYEISKEVNVPLLKKDFIIDIYQIYEAKIYGASAVLLICALLDKERLLEYIALCHSLGMSALVEVHDEFEIDMALNAGARIIGVNNRNLKDFSINLNNSIKLRALVPENILFVAESGIRNREDILMLQDVKVNGVLIGETLMRSRNKRRILGELKGEVYD
jgi:indole-3-glycerol phosphate synthase